MAGSFIYFEREGEGFAEFWEVEQEGHWYSTYSGRVGEEGEGKQQYLNSPQEARDMVRQLVVERQAEGFMRIDPPPPVELLPCAPELLPGEPLSGEEVARFTEQAVLRQTELERLFWEVQLERLLADWVFVGEYPSYSFKHHRLLAQEFEAMAAMESPSMEKEVLRDERRMVVQIRYRIGGLVVLTLRNNEVYTPILPFFSESGRWFHQAEWAVSEVRSLLTHFPSFCAEGFTRVEAYVARKSKRRKLKALAEVGIGTVVKECMRGTGLRYRVLAGHRHSLLHVRVGEAHHVELIMPYATFPERIGGILPTVGVVRALLAGGGMVLSLGDRRRWDAWGTVLRHEYRRYYQEDPRLDFWGQFYGAYERERLMVEGGLHQGGLELQEVLGWDVPGLEREASWVDGRLHAICYSVDGRELLTVMRDGLDFRLAAWHDRTVLPEGLSPALPALRVFLAGLVSFYHAGEAAFNRRFADMARVERAVGVLEGIGRRWIIDTSPAEQLVVELHMPEALFLEVRLGVADFDAQLAMLPSTVERVMGAMGEAPLRFKLYAGDYDGAYGAPWVVG